MAKTIKANLIGKNLKVAIIVSRFNEFISSRLLDGCCDTLIQHGVSDTDISIIWTPGSFEIPTVALKLAKTKNFDAVICVGAIIRGQTPHFEYVSSEVAKGIAKVSLDMQIPCIFGVITADSLEQAIERAGTKDGNKGRDAAVTAIEMANLLSIIK